MDTAAFADRLPSLFPDGDVFADAPLDPRFADVAAKVDGMTTPHTLALLNLAASLLGPAEIYLEVGSYRGRSTVGAALDAAHDRFVAVENFREFGVAPDEGERLIRSTLAEWGLDRTVEVHRGDAFRLVPRGLLTRPVGAYFYDGAHTRLAQYLALGVVEPYFADEAIVVIDDASWPQVASATAGYVRRHPGYRLLFDLAAARQYDTRWCNGVKVYAWRRPAGWKPPSRLDIAARRAMHLYAHEPALTLAWRVLPRFPRLSAGLKKLYLHGGSQVPPPGAAHGRTAGR